MTTTLDRILPNIAKNLLQQFGTDITITRLTSSTFNPATLGQSGTVDAQTVKCSPPSPYRAAQIDGTNVLFGDLSVVIADNDPGFEFAPATGQHASFGGKAYSIVNVETIRSGDEVAAYQCQLRGDA